MKLNKLLIVLMMMLVSIACEDKEEKKTKQEAAYSGHKVTVLEAINGGTYTYLKVSENGSEHWAAITKRETKVGEVLYYSDALEMKNFESKELGRSFEAISFVSKISTEPNSMGGAMNNKGAKKDKPGLSKENISIEVPKGGVTIAELYSNRKSYNEKTVMVSGKITKVNNQIMNRNWAHIQDGTGDSKNFDLTITTNENLKVGDVVTLKGTIAVDKDFGAGYFYEIILESATVISTKEI